MTSSQFHDRDGTCDRSNGPEIRQHGVLQRGRVFEIVRNPYLAQVVDDLDLLVAHRQPERLLQSIDEVRDLILRDVAQVAQRIDDDVVETHDDRKLDEQRETAAGGIEFLLLIHRHQLFLHLLLCRLIVASGVFLADRVRFRREGRLFDLILLLLDRDREQENLHHQREQQDGEHVVVRQRVGETDDISHGDIEDVQNTCHAVVPLL